MRTLAMSGPIVCVDVEGDIGTKVRNEFRAYVEEHPNRFQFVPFRASWDAERDGDVVHRNRDLLWYIGAKWLRDGGAIPADQNLFQELNAPNWCQLNSSPPLLKITPADELSKKLGRQPQAATAFLLSLWEEPRPKRVWTGTAPDPMLENVKTGIQLSREILQDPESSKQDKLDASSALHEFLIHQQHLHNAGIE